MGVGCSKRVPAFEEAGGKILGAGGGPAVDLFEGEEAAAVEFGGVEVEGTVVLRAVEADVFPAGGFARWERGDFFDGGGGADAEFFLDFARGGFGVGLAGVDVSGGAGVPL